MRVREKITTLAQFVPFVGPAAQALLCLRDGVQAIAGHSSLRVTGIYLTPHEGTRRSAIERGADLRPSKKVTKL